MPLLSINFRNVIPLCVVHSTRPNGTDVAVEVAEVEPEEDTVVETDVVAVVV
jgi:hypothetical protein